MVKHFLFLLSLFTHQFLTAQHAVSKIAFGSCANQEAYLGIYNTIVSHKPDLFVFLGDNIYGDTENMDTLATIYKRMGNKPTYKNLKANVPIIATWDDHDYGVNDAGRHYPMKEESKKIFLDFFNEPQLSERRKRKGIYTSYYYKTNGKTLQVILLDCRTFRDNLKEYNNEFKSQDKYFYKLWYAPYSSTETDSTMLGNEQWQWLEQELCKPADVRIIASGSQFANEYNGYEAWANFPHEQKRMLQLIKQTKANGVFFISGDVHYAEISKLTQPNSYPIYDVTASGLSSTWHFATPNNNRVEGPVMENHFGMITINWQATIPTICMEVWDTQNNQRIEHTIKLAEISFE